MKNKILLIVDDIESNKSGAIILRSLAKSINQTSFQCLVVAPSSKISTQFSREKLNGIKVLFFKNNPIKNIGWTRRAINETFLSFNLLRIKKQLMKERIVGIIYYSPTIFFGIAINKLKKIFGVKSYLILRDVFPDWAVDHKFIKKNGIIHKYFNFFKKLNYKSADVIGVMSKTEKNKFKNKKYFKNVEVLPAWIDTNIKINKDVSFREKFNLLNKLVFFYGGNIGKAQNISALINLAILHKKNNDICFVFFGEGDESNLVHNLANSQDNVLFFNSIESKKYNQIACDLDVGLLSLSRFHKISHFPGKAINYMLMKKPILGIVNNSNEFMDVVNNVNCGLICDYNKNWENVLYNNFKFFIKNKESLKLMGNNGFKYVKSFHDTEIIRDKILKKITSFN